MASQKHRPSPRRVVPPSPSHFVRNVDYLRSSTRENGSAPLLPTPTRDTASAASRSPTLHSSTVRSRLFPPGGRRSPRRESNTSFGTDENMRSYGRVKPINAVREVIKQKYSDQEYYHFRPPSSQQPSWASKPLQAPQVDTQALAQDAHARLALWQQQQQQREFSERLSKLSAHYDSLTEDGVRKGQQRTPDLSASRSQPTAERNLSPKITENKQSLQSKPQHGANFFREVPQESPQESSLAALRRELLHRVQEERQGVVEVMQHSHENDVRNAQDLRTALVDVGEAMRVLASLQAGIVSALHQEEQGKKAFASLASQESTSMDLSAMLRSNLYSTVGPDDGAGGEAENGVDSDDSLEREILNISSFSRSRQTSRLAGTATSASVSPSPQKSFLKSLLATDDFERLDTVAACKAASESLRSRCQIVAQRLGPALESFVMHRRAVNDQLRGLQQRMRQLEEEQNTLSRARADLREATAAVHEQQTLQRERLEEETAEAQERLRLEKEDTQTAIKDLEQALSAQLEQQQKAEAVYQEEARALKADHEDLKRREKALGSQRLALEHEVEAAHQQKADAEAKAHQSESIIATRAASLDQELKGLAQRQLLLDTQATKIEEEHSALEARQRAISDASSALQLRERAVEEMKREGEEHLQSVMQGTERQLRDALNTAQRVKQNAAVELQEARAAHEQAVAEYRTELEECRATASQQSAQLQAELGAALNERRDIQEQHRAEKAALEHELELLMQQSAAELREEIELTKQEASNRLAEVQKQHEEKVGLLQTELAEAENFSHEQAKLLVAANQSTRQLQREFQNIALEEDSLDDETGEVAAAFVNSVDSLRHSTAQSKFDEETNPLLQSARAFEKSLVGLAAVAGKSVAATLHRRSETQKLHRRLVEQNSELESITADEMRRTNSRNSELNIKLQKAQQAQEDARQQYEMQLVAMQKQAQKEVQEQLKQHQQATDAIEQSWREHASKVATTLQEQYERELNHETALAQDLEIRLARAEAARDRTEKEAQMRLAESKTFSDEATLSKSELMQLRQSQSEASAEQREKAALAEQKLKFEAEILARDKESLEVDLADIRHDLAVESQRLEKKNRILKQLQTNLAATQKELTATSVDLSKQHALLVEEQSSLQRQQETVDAKEAANAEEEQRLEKAASALKEAEAELSARASRLDALQEALSSREKTAKRTAEDAAEEIMQLKQNHARELEAMKATAEQARQAAQQEIAALNAQHSEALEEAKTASSKLSLQSQEQSDEELRLANEAWSQARAQVAEVEEKTARLRQREREFDDRMQHLDERHQQRSAELQAILDAIEERNSELKKRETEGESQKKLKATLHQMQQQLRHQKDEHARETQSLHERVETAETRLVQATSSTHRLEKRHRDIMAENTKYKGDIANLRELLAERDKELSEIMKRKPKREDRAIEERSSARTASGTNFDHEQSKDSTVDNLVADLDKSERSRAALEVHNTSLNMQNKSLEAEVKALEGKVNILESHLSQGSHSSADVDAASRLSQSMAMDAEILLPLGERLKEALNAQKEELDHLRSSSTKSMQEIAELQSSNESLRASEEQLQRSLTSSSSSSSPRPPLPGAYTSVRAVDADEGTKSPAFDKADEAVQPSQDFRPEGISSRKLSSSAPEVDAPVLQQSSSAPTGAASLREQLLHLQQSIQHSLTDLDDSLDSDDHDGQSVAPGKGSSDGSASGGSMMSIQELAPASADTKEAQPQTKSLSNPDFAYVDQLADVTTARVLNGAHLARLSKVLSGLPESKQAIFEPHLAELEAKQSHFVELEEGIRNSSTPQAQKLQKLQDELSDFASNIADLMEKAKTSRYNTSKSESVTNGSPTEILLASTYLRAASSTTDATARYMSVNSQTGGGDNYGVEHIANQDSIDSDDDSDERSEFLTETTRERRRALGFEDLQ